MTKRKQSPSPATQQMAQLEEQFKLRAVQRAQKLLEMQSATDFWLTSYVDVLDRYREGNQVIYPLSNPQDRRAGSNFPFWTSESQLAIIRASSRLMVTMNPSAYGLINGLTSYVIGSGYTYRATAIEGSGVKGSLVRAVQRAIDNFVEENSWKEMEQELFFRSREDGEAFLRFFPQDSGSLQVRTMEPEQVIQPPDSTFDEWSYGIQTDIDDVFEIKAYYAHYSAPGGVSMLRDGVYGEIIPADQVVHIKCNVKRAIKRGLPDLSFDTLETFSQGSKLRRNMGEGAAVQSAIAAVRQHDTASSSQVETFAQSAIDYSMQLPFGGRQQDYSRIDAGSFLDIPKGMNYIPPPGAINASAHLSIYEALLRAAGTRHNAPEWLVSGDASNNNYASSLTAESPFLRNCQRLQSFMKRPFLRVITEAVKNAIDAGRLPKDTLKLVEIVATAPTVETRNRGEEASANQVYSGLGVKSRQTIAQEIGLDWEREAKEIEAYNERFGKDGEGPEKGKAPPDKTPPKGGSPDKEKPAPESITEDDGYAMDVMEDENCGIGSGGFKKGNKCAKKKGGSKADDDADPFGSAFDDITFDPTGKSDVKKKSATKPAKKPEPAPKPKSVTPPTPPPPPAPPVPPAPVRSQKHEYKKLRTDYPGQPANWPKAPAFKPEVQKQSDMNEQIAKEHHDYMMDKYGQHDDPNATHGYKHLHDIGVMFTPYNFLAKLIHKGYDAGKATRLDCLNALKTIDRGHFDVTQHAFIPSYDATGMSIGQETIGQAADKLVKPLVESEHFQKLKSEVEKLVKKTEGKNPEEELEKLRDLRSSLSDKYGPEYVENLPSLRYTSDEEKDPEDADGKMRRIAYAIAEAKANALEDIASRGLPINPEVAKTMPMIAKKSLDVLAKVMGDTTEKIKDVVDAFDKISKDPKNKKGWRQLFIDSRIDFHRRSLEQNPEKALGLQSLEEFTKRMNETADEIIVEWLEARGHKKDDYKELVNSATVVMYRHNVLVDLGARRKLHEAITKPSWCPDVVDVQKINDNSMAAGTNKQWSEQIDEGLAFVRQVSMVPCPHVLVGNNATEHFGRTEFTNRAFATRRDGREGVFFWEDDAAHVMVHELGHSLESTDTYVHRMVQMFLAYRVGDEEPKKMSEVTGNANFKDYEVGRKDNFDKVFNKPYQVSSAYYAGKDYGGRASEILSMGIEALYQDPAHFFKADPEYANFVVSILQYSRSKGGKNVQGPMTEAENCGIGSGGFKKGNTCATGKGGVKANSSDPFGSQFDDISFDATEPVKKPSKPKAAKPKPKVVAPPKPVAPPPAPTPPPAPPKPVAPPTPPPKPKPDFTPKRADHPEDAEVFAINKNYPAHKKMTNDMLDSLGRANAVTAHKRHISGDNTITFYDGAKDVSHKILPVHEYTGGGGIGGHLETLAQILSGDILRTVADQYRPNSPGYRVGDPHEEVKDFMYRHVKQGSLTNQDEVMIGLGLKADRKTGDLKTPNIEAFLSTGSMKEMKRRFDHSITMTPQSISAELESKYGPSVLGELGIGNGNHQELATAHAFMGINEELAESAHPVSYELAQKFPQLAKKSVEALMKPMAEKFAKSQHLVKDLSPFSKKQIGELKTEQDWEALKKSTSDPVIRKKLNDDFSSVFNRANLEKMAWERHGVDFDFSSTAIPNAFEKMRAITDELKAKARDHIKAQYTTPATVDEVYRRSDHSKKLLDVQVGDKIDTGGSGGLNLKVDLKPTPGYKKLTSEAANFIDSISEIPVHDVVMFNRADALMNGMNPNDKSKEVRAFANSRVGALGSLASRSLTDTNEAWKAFRPAVFTPESKVIEKEYHSEKEWAEHYSKSTMIHELGHIIEGNDKYVTDMAQMFLAHRLKGEKPVRMKDVVPHSSYGDSEMGRKDNFDKTFDLNQAYYIGKDYGKHASEVLAMGLQQLYNNPKNFLEKDPEYAHFVISVLQYKTAHESLRKDGK